MDELTSIRTVADHFGLPLSTLHFWERRGLIRPHRRSGHRYFDTEQLYRVALIKHWRDVGRLRLSDIGAILEEGPDDWRETVQDRLRAIDEERARLEEAQAYLRTLLHCEQEDDLGRCPGFRARVSVPA